VVSLEYVGFNKHRPGKIHLYCVHCGQKMSNCPRTQYDPKRAVLAHIPCEECSNGCKVEGASLYLDANGKPVDPFEDMDLEDGDEA
jgi:hypothetical protein